jgi:hypothetical protein
MGGEKMRKEKLTALAFMSLPVSALLLEFATAALGDSAETPFYIPTDVGTYTDYLNSNRTLDGTMSLRTWITS